jgi:hypothetical protein
MRELKRSVARNLMKMHGIEQINKKKFLIPGSKAKRSYFSMYWRDYLNPESEQRKDLRKKAERALAVYKRLGVRV